MKCHVAFWRFHHPYFMDAKTLIAKVPYATNVYEAIDHLNMMEYFSCQMELLVNNQDPQIPIRWE